MGSSQRISIKIDIYAICALHAYIVAIIEIIYYCSRSLQPLLRAMKVNHHKRIKDERLDRRNQSALLQEIKQHVNIFAAHPEQGTNYEIFVAYRIIVPEESILSKAFQHHVFTVTDVELFHKIHGGNKRHFSPATIPVLIFHFFGKSERLEVYEEHIPYILTFLFKWQVLACFQNFLT